MHTQNSKSSRAAIPVLLVFPVCSLLLCALCASALSFSFLVSSAPPNAQASPAHTRSYLGFDRNIYPGDEALPILRRTFWFASYWLSPPPGEKRNTWNGKREVLHSKGFGFLVLYRGPQSSELQSIWSESRFNHADRLEAQSEKRGTADASQAAAIAKKEGFSSHTTIFLDVEEGGRLPAVYHVYLRAWADQLTQAGYGAGVYCSGMPVSEGRGATIITADDIRNNIGTRDLMYWVYNDACPPSPGCAFPQDPPAPSKSGIPYAAVWQFWRSPRPKESTSRCPARYAPDGNCYVPADTVHKWFLDVNTATSPDPSGGAK